MVCDNIKYFINTKLLYFPNNEVYLFDVINPSYTVKTIDNNYDNVRHEYYDDYKKYFDNLVFVIHGVFPISKYFLNTP